MVVVEHLLGGIEVLADARTLRPGHAQEPVEVVADHGRLGGHRRHLLELVELGAGLGLDRLGHAGLLDAARQLLQFVRRLVQLAELLLDRLHLFVEVVLALALLHLRLDAAADALLDLLDVDLAVDVADQHLQARGDVDRLEHLLLVDQADVQVRGDGVGQPAGVVDAGERGEQLGRDLPVELDELLELVEQGAPEHLELALLARQQVGDRLGARGELTVLLAQAQDAAAGKPLDQHLDGAVRELEQLQDRRHRGDVEQLTRTRIVDLRAGLGDQQDLLVALHRGLEGANGLLPPDEQRDHHVRIDDHVPEGQDGQFGVLREISAHVDRCHAGRAGASPVRGARSKETGGGYRECKPPRGAARGRTKRSGSTA